MTNATWMGMMIILLSLVVAASDCDDADREQAVYCGHIRDGVWPDYRGDYKEICQ